MCSTLVSSSSSSEAATGGVLKNLAKFILREFHFYRVAGMKPAILLKNDGGVKFCEIFESIFFAEHLRVTASTCSTFSPAQQTQFSARFGKLDTFIMRK